MDFWSQYWAIFLGITSAMVTLEVGMVGLHYLMGLVQQRKMKEIQDRMASGDLTDAEVIPKKIAQYCDQKSISLLLS